MVTIILNPYKNATPKLIVLKRNINPPRRAEPAIIEKKNTITKTNLFLLQENI